MKNIICLFLMATTLTLASASATTYLEPSHVETVKEHIQLDQQELVHYNGGGMDICALYGFGIDLLH